MSDDSRSRSRSEELEDRVDELGDKFAKRVSTLESDARKVSTEQRKSELKSLAEAEQDPESALVVFDDSTEEERKERRGRVIESFDVFDFTDNGTISMGELASIMFLVGLEDPMARERVAAQMNIKDGEIQRDDFLAAMGPFIRGAEPDEDTEVLHKIYAAIQEEQVINLRVAFEACDDDDSGEIDRDELALVMAKLGENPSAEELDAMYDELNEDGEGGIDFQEFITFMCKRGAMGMFNVDALVVAGSFRSDKVISPEESARIMKEMPVLERLGANFMKDFYRERALQRRNSVESKYNNSEVRRKSRMEQQERERMAAEDRMQLMKQQRKDIKKMERIAIGLDMLLGALSAIISGFAEEVARDEWRNDGIADDCKAADNCSDLGNRIVYFWLLVGGVSLVATVAEVVLIYYVHLKISIRISRITGLKLFPVDKERAFVTAALARAALELPHPAKKEYGVDPLEEASKARLFVATLVYKAKTGLSTFIIRIMLKRVLARAAVKSLLSFVAVPVNMFWNALIGYKCLRQVRVIALGPSLAQDVMGQVLASRHGNISDDVKVGIIRAIATVIVTKEMMHPNMQILLKFTKDQLGLELSDDAIGVEHVDSVLPPGGIEDARRKSAKNPNMSRNSSANADEAGPADVELEEVIVSPSQTTDDLLGRNDGSSQVQPDEENGRASASTPVKDIAENNDGVDGDDDDSRRDAFDRPGRLSYFIAHLDWLNDVDKLFVLRVLCFAMILDGHVSSSLASVFRKVAFRVPGVEPNNLWPLHLLTLRFIRGELKGNDIIYLFDEQAGRLDDDRKPLGQGFRGKCNYYTDRCLVFFSC